MGHLALHLDWSWYRPHLTFLLGAPPRDGALSISPEGTGRWQAAIPADCSLPPRGQFPAGTPAGAGGQRCGLPPLFPSSLALPTPTHTPPGETAITDGLQPALGVLAPASPQGPPRGGARCTHRGPGRGSQQQGHKQVQQHFHLRERSQVRAGRAGAGHRPRRCSPTCGVP